MFVLLYIAFFFSITVRGTDISRANNDTKGCGNVTAWDNVFLWNRSLYLMKLGLLAVVYQLLFCET